MKNLPTYDDFLNEGKKITSKNKKSDNKLIDKFVKGLGSGEVDVAYNMITVRNAVIDMNRNANFTLAFDRGQYLVFGDDFETRKASEKEITNDTDLYNLVAAAVNGFSFKAESNEVNEGFKNPSTDEYGKQMWDGHQKDIIAMARKMAENYADLESYELVCMALADVFEGMANTNDAKLIKKLSE